MNRSFNNLYRDVTGRDYQDGNTMEENRAADHVQDQEEANQEALDALEFDQGKEGKQY